MKKYTANPCLIFAVTITLLISACSTVKNSKPANEQQNKQPPAPAAQAPSPSNQQLELTVTSIADLTALFEQLKYSRNNCTEDKCEIPRITFNGIGKDWQETSDKLPVKIKKELFFRLMAPLVLIANEQIQDERNIVKKSALDSDALKTIALKYSLIKSRQSNLDENLRNKLLQRVDILPPSLALAQAAEESGWATSRFAMQGNAFFGQWDFSGKGMKPLLQRKGLGNYGVARFASPLASVEAYMFNLNTNKAYQKLRALRMQLRAANKAITGYGLAGTMDKYSERGQAYIDGLQKMIRYNKLDPIDQAYLANKHLIHITVN